MEIVESALSRTYSVKSMPPDGDHIIKKRWHSRCGEAQKIPIGSLECQCSSSRYRKANNSSVLAVIGARRDGQKVPLSIRKAGNESAALNAALVAIWSEELPVPRGIC